MKGALEVHRQLLQDGLLHEIVRLPHPLASGDDLPDLTGLPAEDCAVVRLYLAERRTGAATVAAAVVPAGASVELAALARALGLRTLQEAPVETVNRVTDFPASFVCPALLPPEVLRLVDRRLVHDRTLYTPTGDAGTALAIPAPALLELLAAPVGDVARVLAAPLALR